MKKVSILFLSWFLSAFSYKAMAQEDVKIKDKKKKTEEIIIRKSGDKDVTMTIQITGDKIIVNGKPITEFTDSTITINTRNITVWDKDDVAIGRLFNRDNFAMDFDGGSKVVLGVVTEKDDAGAIVNEVTKDGAAEKAGLQKGDIITKFGNSKIEDPQDLYDAVNDNEAGAQVKIEYKRNGKTQTATAKLQERKDRVFGITTPNGARSYTIPRVSPTKPHYDAIIQDQINQSMDFAYAFGRPKLGLKIQDTEDEKGVKVLSVEQNSASATAGMKTDDIIIAIGDKKVQNTDEVREALHDNESKSYTIKALRNGKEMKFDIKIPKKLKTANL